MIMDNLKVFVTTIATMLVFISAIEIISPDNKMKRYINFVLGLILIAVVLNPIIEFISSGEDSIVSAISEYEEIFESENQENNEQFAFNEDSIENDGGMKKTFTQNFNKNCEMLLEKEFHDMKFECDAECDAECDVDFNELSYDIKNLKIVVNDKSIKKIKNIEIKDVQTNIQEGNEKYESIIDFISEELGISKEKIEIYDLGE